MPNLNFEFTSSQIRTRILSLDSWIPSLESRISNLKSQNFESQISNLESRISILDSRILNLIVGIGRKKPTNQEKRVILHECGREKSDLSAD